MRDVDEFISKFYTSDDISEVFSGEMSYWFAVLLRWRFIRDGAQVVFDQERKNYGGEDTRKSV